MFRSSLWLGLPVSLLLLTQTNTGVCVAAVHVSAAQHNAVAGALQDTPAGGKKTGSAKDRDEPLPASMVTKPVLWHQSADIASLDLYEGQGGTKHAPRPPFTFLEENKSGTNPKFDVTDADGHKWRVKLGEEARPEVVASRLLWAMGYIVNDD